MNLLIFFVLIFKIFFEDLTPEMDDIINKALRGHPPGEVLVEGYRLQITRGDIATLAGLNWLNDEVSTIIHGNRQYIVFSLRNKTLGTTQNEEYELDASCLEAHHKTWLG